MDQVVVFVLRSLTDQVQWARKQLHVVDHSGQPKTDVLVLMNAIMTFVACMLIVVEGLLRVSSGMLVL